MLILIFSFWIGYIALSFFQIFVSAHRDILISEERTKKQVEFVLSAAITDLIRDNLESLQTKLNRAYELQLIHFYILQKEDQAIYFKNSSNNVEEIDHDYKNFDVFLKSGDVNFKTIKIFNYRLTAGFISGDIKTTLKAMWAYKTEYLIDVFLITTMLGLLAWMVMKDILSLSRVLADKERPLHLVRSVSKEGEILIKATKSYDTANQNLQKESSTYSAALTPAIVAEIKSGKKAPYTFTSTLARVDLNGYTQIFLSKKSDYITEILNTYFQQARELIERYDGLIYQYVGDEIVFHFKGEHQDSVRRALACMRGLFEIADKIEKTLPENADHCFKLKGSLIFDNLRFCQLDTGYSLSGTAMIESNRLLSQIDDRTKNTVIFSESDIGLLKDLCFISSIQEAQLKGFQGKARVAISHQFLSVKDFKANFNSDILSYYRSDEDITALLSFMCRLVMLNNDKLFFTLFNHMKSFTVRSTTAAVVSGYLKVLKACRDQTDLKKGDDKIYSSVVSLCGTLIPHKDVSNEIIEALNHALHHRDHRVQANAIFVLGQLAADLDYLKEFILSPNNRVAADALYVTGRKNLSKKVIGTLQDFITSPNPLFSASAQWVITQLLKHYQEVDPVFFNTSPLISDLRNLLEKTRTQKDAA